MAFLASLAVFSLNSIFEEWRMCMVYLTVFLSEVVGKLIPLSSFYVFDGWYISRKCYNYDWLFLEYWVDQMK